MGTNENAVYDMVKYTNRMAQQLYHTTCQTEPIKTPVQYMKIKYTMMNVLLKKS
mgnify:CR=1 FL=1